MPARYNHEIAVVNSIETKKSKGFKILYKVFDLKLP